MKEVALPEKLKKSLGEFVTGIKEIYSSELISVIIYGSAASGEFIAKRSNVNLLVVLANTDIATLQKATGLIRKCKRCVPLFLTEKYITSSLDVFPVEFLDMQENHVTLDGRDILKDLKIELNNLRFQCEQELKAKLIHLKQIYLNSNKDKAALREALFKYFTSVTHISRNLLRLKNRMPTGKKEDIFKGLAEDFKIDPALWEKIWLAMNNKITVNNQDIEQIYGGFVKDLEKIVGIVDEM
jgi:hypothetical protein